MLLNLEKNGWLDRFLTLQQYDVLPGQHRERIRYATEMYAEFRDFSVFKAAIMDPEMVKAMGKSEIIAWRQYQR